MENMLDNPLYSDADIVDIIAAFAHDEQFLFFATVAKSWSAAWQRQQRPKITRAVTDSCTESHLKYCVVNGLARETSAICDALARSGNLDLLQRVHDEGYPWSESTFSAAAEGGHLEVLKWLRLKGCPWGQSTCHGAARGGHVHVLHWARSNGCFWDSATCANAARHGHLDTLTWLKEKWCPWNSNTCAEAAGGGHMHILRWARLLGCPWDENTCNKVGAVHP